MTPTPKKILFLFSLEENLETFKNLSIPIDFERASLSDLPNISIDYCVADIKGFENSVDFLLDCEFPEKIIILSEGFNPVHHIKKETVLINSLQIIEDSLFWDNIQGEEKKLIYRDNAFANYINNVFQIGGVLDQINFSLQDTFPFTIEMMDSISKIGQFISSLFHNKCWKDGVEIVFSKIEETESFGIDVSGRVLDLDPGYILDYMKIDSKDYREKFLFEALSQADFSSISLDKNIISLKIRFSKKNRRRVVSFKIDKIVDSLSSFIDPENLTVEKTGVLLDFSDEIQKKNFITPGVDHKPKLTPEKKASVEELVVTVLGHKENFSDQFDLGKVKTILSEDERVNVDDFNEDELNKIKDITNDVETTMALARAKEDVFNQLVGGGDIEGEFVKVVNSLEEDDLPYVLSGKAEISLEEDDKVVVKEPDVVQIDGDIVVLGEEEKPRDEVVKVLGEIQEKLKNDIIKVKGELKTKEDVEEFVVKAVEEVNPEFRRFGKNISQNLMSGLLSNRMDDLVYSKKSWNKMNEMIQSFKLKIESKDKQIESLQSTIETLSRKENDKEMHPVFKEIVSNVNKEQGSEGSDSNLERIIKRKDMYIKKLENKLIDKQASEIKVIVNDSKGALDSEIIFKKGTEEKELFSPKIPSGQVSGENKRDLRGKDEEISKLKNIGQAMAKKLRDLNLSSKEFREKHKDLLIEKNTIFKENRKLMLLERKYRKQAEDLEKKMSNLNEQKITQKVDKDQKKAERDQTVEKNLGRKIEKLESLNQKLSDSTKSLVKKLTKTKQDYHRLKMDKKALEQRLNQSEGNLYRLKEKLQKQLASKTKKAS